MLSVSVVTFLVVFVTGAAVWTKYSWRSLWLLAGALELLGLVLLGLPGAAFLESGADRKRRTQSSRTVRWNDWLWHEADLSRTSAIRS